MSEFLPPDQCQPPLQPDPEGGWDLEVALAALAQPIDFDAVFGRKAPLEIEIGCGSGIFLAHEAADRPEVNFFGVERDKGEVYRAKDKWRRRNLLNTRILHCDAPFFMEDYVTDACVDRCVILFSDPWPKKRHHKRRLFQPRLLPILERTIKPGGRLFIKTDVTEYYDVMIELFAGSKILEKISDKRLDLVPESGDIVTNFQRKALEKGHPIHAMEYVRG